MVAPRKLYRICREATLFGFWHLISVCLALKSSSDRQNLYILPLVSKIESLSFCITFIIIFILTNQCKTCKITTGFFKLFSC